MRRCNECLSGSIGVYCVRPEASTLCTIASVEVLDKSLPAGTAQIPQTPSLSKAVLQTAGKTGKRLDWLTRRGSGVDWSMKKENRGSSEDLIVG